MDNRSVIGGRACRFAKNIDEYLSARQEGRGKMNLKEPLIYSHMVATVAWRDEMQGATRSQGLFSLTSGATRQFARQAPSRRACFARFQRGGCGQIGCSLPCTAWHRSPGYDLRRARRDLPDLTRFAPHGGVNQWFSKKGLKKVRHYAVPVGATYEAGDSMRALQQEASIPSNHDWRQIGQQKVRKDHR